MKAGDTVINKDRVIGKIVAFILNMPVVDHGEYSSIYASTEHLIKEDI